VVDPLLDTSVIVSVNWAEVLQKTAHRGRDAEEVHRLFRELDLPIIPFTAEDAPSAARLWAAAPFLSLGDRCCLAVSQRLCVPAITADRAWSESDVGMDIVLIR
jgi:PIN domain nuclease of toxin-antitoxin system